MPDIFTPAILKLQEMGVFNFFFPFMLVSAVTYGLLRKSEIFGPPEDNATVNAVVALMISFMVWSYPLLSGVNIGEEMANLFMHGFTVSLVMLVSIMLIGMFAPPNLPEHLSKTILGGNKFGMILILGLLLGFLVFVTSGIYKILFPDTFIQTSLVSETIPMIGVLVILILPLIFIMWGGGKTTPSPPSSEEKE